MKTYTLRNADGMELEVAAYGGIIRTLRVPDRDGRLDDVVLGFDSIEDYVAANPHYFGAIVGRYANRIARGRFNLDGDLHWLAKNQGPNHIHGGRKGFDKVTWEAGPVPGGAGAIGFRYTSPDGEEGYPGTLEVRVRYALMKRNQLVVDYFATTDAATPVNLTQHSYFNLSGDPGSDVLDHVVTINADQFTPVDDTMVPTGETRSVAGTPFDFRQPTALRGRIDDADPQLRLAGGYDQNFVLNPGTPGEPVFAARVYEPTSGRVLTVHTMEPGLQFYTGNQLAGVAGKDGALYGPRAGLALETQHFPDSPNQPTFPSSILRPGEKYRSRTIFTFSVRHD